MLLTVHDELVFEVSRKRVEEAAELVKREMEAAYELDVPLRADIGWGPTGPKRCPRATGVPSTTPDLVLGTDPVGRRALTVPG